MKNNVLVNHDTKEIEKILKTLTIVVDTREQKNEHVIEYFEARKIPYIVATLKTCDYMAYIPKNPELNILQDISLNTAIERKNGIDELVGSFKDRNRFENEMIRTQKMQRFVLLVEDVKGYEKIINGKYRSKYEPKSLLGSLKAFEVRYNFTAHFINKQYTGNYIYYYFSYFAREALKNGEF